MVTATPERADVPPPLSIPPHEVAPDLWNKLLLVHLNVLLLGYMLPATGAPD